MSRARPRRSGLYFVGGLGHFCEGVEAKPLVASVFVLDAQQCVRIHLSSKRGFFHEERLLMDQLDPFPACVKEVQWINDGRYPTDPLCDPLELVAGVGVRAIGVNPGVLVFALVSAELLGKPFTVPDLRDFAHVVPFGGRGLNNYIIKSR